MQSMLHFVQKNRHNFLHLIQGFKTVVLQLKHKRKKMLSLLGARLFIDFNAFHNKNQTETEHK